MSSSDSLYRQRIAPSNAEWEKAKVACNILKPFYNATNLFLGSNYPTANVFFDEIWEIRLKLLEELKVDNFLQELQILCWRSL